MEGRSDPIHGELLMETQGGRAMDHPTDELADAGYGQPHSWFGGLVGERCVAGDVKIQHNGLQS
jgi:hypothetical protein